MQLIILIVSLAIILIGADVFTNGVEWLGKKLKLSEGCVGSILAAVGTALPETMIPVIAILFGSGEDAGHIGIGAILGAPFMLATLALGITGIAGIVFKHRGQKRQYMNINARVMKRDLLFFLIVFSVAILASFAPPILKKAIIIALIMSYGFYAYLTVKDSNDSCEAEQELHPLRCAPKSQDPPLYLIIAQIVGALGIIVAGAHLFVGAISYLSGLLGIPAFVLSIIIAPIATELPEKFNSLIWIRQGKDTLALGNITGAMVFQSSLIPALGIALTPWELNPLALTSAVLALLSAGTVYLALRFTGKIKPTTLIGVSSFYLVFIAVVIVTGGGAAVH